MSENFLGTSQIVPNDLDGLVITWLTPPGPCSGLTPNPLSWCWPPPMSGGDTIVAGSENLGTGIPSFTVRFFVPTVLLLTCVLDLCRKPLGQIVFAGYPLRTDPIMLYGRLASSIFSLCRAFTPLNGVGGDPRKWVLADSGVILSYVTGAYRTSTRNGLWNSESAIWTWPPHV